MLTRTYWGETVRLVRWVTEMHHHLLAPPTAPAGGAETLRYGIRDFPASADYKRDPRLCMYLGTDFGYKPVCTLIFV